MNSILTAPPALCVTERSRFSSDGSLDFVRWLDLISGARWTNPETGIEARFDGIELSIPHTVNEATIADYCQFVAHEVGSRGLRIAAIHPCLEIGSALGTTEQGANFFHAARIGVQLGKQLADWDLRIGNILRITSSTNTFAWSSGNLTNNSAEIKTCLRNVAELAADNGQSCALEMRCDLAAMTSPATVLRMLALIYRPNVGILANTANLAYCVFGPNFPDCSRVESWNCGRDQFDSAYQAVCSEIGCCVTHVHVAQTALRRTEDANGTVYGHRTHAADPEGVLDFDKHPEMLLSHVPGGLQRLGSISWDGLEHSVRRLELPGSWTTALGVLARIREERVPVSVVPS